MSFTQCHSGIRSRLVAVITSIDRLPSSLAIGDALGLLLSIHHAAAAISTVAACTAPLLPLSPSHAPSFFFSPSITLTRTLSLTSPSTQVDPAERITPEEALRSRFLEGTR